MLAFAAEQSLKSYGQAADDAGDMTHGRDDGVLHKFGSLFHAVHGAADHVVSADHLQPGAVNHVADSVVHALNLGAKRGGGGGQIFGNGVQLLARIHEDGAGGVEHGQSPFVDLAGHGFHAGATFFELEVERNQDSCLDHHGKGRNDDKCDQQIVHKLQDLQVSKTSGAKA